MPFEPAYSWNVNLEQLEAFKVEAVKFSEDHAEPPFRITRMTGDFGRAQLGYFRSPSMSSSLIINCQGSLLVGTPGVHKATVFPAKAALFVRGGGLAGMKITAGEHDMYVIEWDGPETPFIETYVAALAGARPNAIKEYAVGGLTYEIFDRVNQLLKAPAEYAAAHPLRSISLLYELSEICLQASDTAHLAEIPGGLPRPVQTVVNAVLANREAKWDLKAAAELVSYSPFHFSRLFRTYFGFGFHVFVEKCRSERALRYIADDDLHIDLAARKAGFGSSQALRIAIRDNLGMSPSELRQSAEQFGQMIG